MLIIRKYKKNRIGEAFWEYKIYFKDPFTRKTKFKRRGGFKSQEEARNAGIEMMGNIRHKQ
jgi:hypothetical protein